VRGLAEAPTDRRGGAVRLGLLAMAAAELEAKAAREPLKRIAARLSLHPFVKHCADDALAVLSGAAPPGTVLLLPRVRYVTTDLHTEPGDSIEVAAEAAGPDDSDRHVDDFARLIAGDNPFVHRPVANVRQGLSLRLVDQIPQRLVALEPSRVDATRTGPGVNPPLEPCIGPPAGFICIMIRR